MSSSVSVLGAPLSPMKKPLVSETGPEPFSCGWGTMWKQNQRGHRALSQL